MNSKVPLYSEISPPKREALLSYGRGLVACLENVLGRDRLCPSLHLRMGGERLNLNNNRRFFMRLISGEGPTPLRTGFMEKTILDISKSMPSSPKISDLEELREIASHLATDRSLSDPFLVRFWDHISERAKMGQYAIDSEDLFPKNFISSKVMEIFPEKNRYQANNISYGMTYLPEDALLELSRVIRVDPKRLCSYYGMKSMPEIPSSYVYPSSISLLLEDGSRNRPVISSGNGDMDIRHILLDLSDRVGRIENMLASEKKSGFWRIFR